MFLPAVMVTVGLGAFLAISVDRHLRDFEVFDAGLAPRPMIRPTVPAARRVSTTRSVRSISASSSKTSAPMTSLSRSTRRLAATGDAGGGHLAAAGRSAHASSGGSLVLSRAAGGVSGRPHFELLPSFAAARRVHDQHACRTISCGVIAAIQAAHKSLARPDDERCGAGAATRLRTFSSMAFGNWLRAPPRAMAIVTSDNSRLPRNRCSIVSLRARKTSSR